jgi:alpha-beta hydrolase superfamily lysophospholipase
MDDVMKSVEDRLPVEQVELSTGRAVAVHHRRSPTGKLRLFFVHGSCASMLQYAELIEHFSAAGYVSPS